jgi:hypothetical protein
MKNTSKAKSLALKISTLVAVEKETSRKDVATYAYGIYLAAKVGDETGISRYYKNMMREVTDLRPARVTLDKIIELGKAEASAA